MVILPRLFDADFKAPKGAFLALYHKAMKNSLYGVLGTMCIYHLWLNHWGLSIFSIQGALLCLKMVLPLNTILNVGI